MSVAAVLMSSWMGDIAWPLTKVRIPRLKLFGYVFPAGLMGKLGSIYAAVQQRRDGPIADTCTAANGFVTRSPCRRAIKRRRRVSADHG